MASEDEKHRALINVNITDILGLSKAGETLAKAVERGTGRAAAALGRAAGRLAYPFLLKRDTEAEIAAASAYLDMLKGRGLLATDAEVQLHGRTLARITAETARFQINRENTARLAITDHIESKAGAKSAGSAADTSIDWVDAFWRHAENISDESMQRAWARVLVREAEAPGTFSLRALALLATLSHREAEAIVAVGRVAYEIISPAYGGIDHGVITEMGSDSPHWTKEIAGRLILRMRSRLPVVDHILEPIGIFRESGFSHQAVASPGDGDISLRIGDRTLVISGLLPDREGIRRLGGGHGITSVGWELMQIARPSSDTQYVETLKEAYEKQGCTVIVC